MNKSEFEQNRYNMLKEVLFNDLLRQDDLESLKKYLERSPELMKRVIRENYDVAMDKIKNDNYPYKTFDYLKETFPDLYETYTGQTPDYLG